jgi:pyruvate decarboxylase
VLWGSIGYATAATLGVAFAASEEGLGRVHCFTGDGSFQLTAQELSTMIRYGLAPVVWALRNDGYEVGICVSCASRAALTILSLCR